MSDEPNYYPQTQHQCGSADDNSTFQPGRNFAHSGDIVEEIPDETVHVYWMKCCARCGEGHRDLTFYRLDRAHYCSAFEVMRYWALCPTNGQPILLGSKVDLDQVQDEEA